MIEEKYKFAKQFFFTNIPINFIYKYKDNFQIYPYVNPEFKPPSNANHFVNCLEISLNESVLDKSDIIDPDTLHEFLKPREMKTIEILNLFTLFSNHHFFKYEPNHQSWGIILDPEFYRKYPELSESNWTTKLFYRKDLKQDIDSFSETSFEKIILSPVKGYYTDNPNIDIEKDKFITLPITLNTLFDSYFSLEGNELIAFNNSLYFFKNGVELLNSKKTLALISFFTSIESIIDYCFSIEEKKHCEKCGQLQFKISEKFKSFLLKYIGNSENNKKKFNKFYSLRSKIIHRGLFLKSELLFSEASIEEKSDDEKSVLEIMQMCRFALTNYLAFKNQDGDKLTVRT